MKRILALILTLCLVFSLLPSNTIAVGTGEQNQNTNAQQNGGAVLLNTPAVHTDHYACSCAVTGGNACAGHTGSQVTAWTEWTDKTTLPTEGNYCLSTDVTLSTAIEISDTLNLCLNGYSVQFNAANTDAPNLHVKSGATLNIVNCQAKLDGKGLFVSGNKEDATDLTAGRLYGSRSTSGAVLLEGTLNVTGVEFYGNGEYEKVNGGAVQIKTAGVLNSVHSKFDANEGSWGGAISNQAGNVAITLDDTVITNSRAKGGAAVYLKGYDDTTAAPTLTIMGDSRLVNNTAVTGSGGAVYTSSTQTGLDMFITLQDNVVITGNTTASAKGAIAMDQGTLQVSGNVQLAGNKTTNTSATAALNSVFASRARVNVMSDLGPNARIGIGSTMAGYLNTRIKADTGATLTETAHTGLFLENTAELGYGTSGFYQVTSSDHKHYHGACAITGDANCAHSGETEITYQPWFSTTSLPTKGNWYLVYDVVVTSAAQVKLADGEELNLCLNGYSIGFNPDIAKTENLTNYYLNVGSEMNIINCQAELDANGLLESGNKNDPANETAGRLYGGRGLYGGAIYVKGALNVIGVEFYDNQAYLLRDIVSGYGGALRLQDGGALNAMHSKFDNNKALINGGAISAARGDVEVYLHDTVLTNNEAIGVYRNSAGTLYATQEANTYVDTRYGFGGAINFTVNSGSGAAKITKAAVLQITGDSRIEGNKTGETTGNYGGAIAMINTNPNGFTPQLIIEDEVQILNNTAQTSGGALYISRTGGNDTPEITIKDNVKINGNKAGTDGGAMVVERACKVTLSGNVQISENEAAKRGGALFINRPTGSPAGQIPEVTITDNVTITKNRAVSGNGGAVYLGTGDNLTTVYLKLSGNVQIKENQTGGKGPDVYLWTNKGQNLAQRVKVGQMGANAKVHVTVNLGSTSLAITDPDEFLVADGISQTTEDTGIVFANTNAAVGYSTDAGVQFNFGHIHHACSCALAGGDDCGVTHAGAIEWIPWTDASSLPTVGNWYLTCDLVVTSDTQVKLADGEELNLCLNGYSIQFNPDIAKTADQTNYYLNVGSKMNIVNCQAKLDSNGLLESGDIKNPSNEKAGRLFGGRGLYGGAIYVKGALSVYGVEFYDNQAYNLRNQNAIANGYGGALRLQDGGTLKAMHAKFSNNKALINGGAITVARGNGEVYLHDTVLTGNEVIGVYADDAGKLYTTQEADTFIDTTKGRGGAIHVAVNHGSGAAAMTKAPVLQISGNSVIEGNKTGETTGNQGGAIAMVSANPNGFTPQLIIEDEVQILGNTAQTAGGAIYVSRTGGENAPEVTIKDSVKISGNKAGTDGGAIAVERGCKLTLSGNVQISENEAAKRGGALFINRPTDTPAGQVPEVTIADNVVITKNKALGGNGGAIYLATGDNKTTVYLTLSGNVQIKDNETGGKGPNVYLWTNVGKALAQQLLLDGLTAKAEVYVTVNMGAAGLVPADPDAFMALKEGTTLEDTKKSGILYESIDPPVHVAYSNDKNVLFYFGGEYAAHDDHALCICAVTASDSCKHDTTMQWTVWPYKDQLPTLTGNYYLTGDIVVTSNSGAGSIGVFEVKNGQKVNLCLNGYSIKFYEKNTGKANYYAMQGSELNIINCKAVLDSSGKYVSGNATNPQGGQITGGRGMYGGAIYNKGNMTLIGLAFRGNQATNKTNGIGGAIRMQDGGVLNIRSSLFEGNSAMVDGGAIAIGRQNSVLTIQDTIFNKNTAKVYGGALAITDKGSLKATELKLTGCAFTGNTAAEGGGAIYQVITNSELTNVTISQNEAKNGGAIYMYLNSQATFTDVTVSQNKGVNCGGVYVRSSKATFNKGTLIKENQAESGGGLIGHAKAELVIDGAVIEQNTANAGGGITLWDRTLLKLVDGQIRNNSAKTSNGGGIFMQSGSDMQMSGGSITGNTAAKYGGAIGCNKNNDKQTEIEISGGEISGNKALYGGGVYVLSTMLTVSGGKITENTADSYGGGIYAGNSAYGVGETVIAGGQIVANTAEGGGGVYQSTETVGKYSSGCISGNSAKNGGGVYIKTRAKAELGKDFVISENAAKSGGGGVALQAQAELTMNGGIIEKNTCANGAGLVLWSQSVLNLNDGQIRQNTAEKSGAAIYMHGGSVVNMAGGMITENVAHDYAGGLYASFTNDRRCAINLTGGKISKNSCMGKTGADGKVSGGYGGGAYLLTCDVKLDGIEVSENKANYGGGLFMSNCKVDFTKGLITKNFAEKNGGGISTSRVSEITMNGKEAIVSYNSTNGPAGGIRLSGSDTGSVLTLIQGTVKGNTAKQQGGGIFLNSKSQLYMKGGIVTGNTAGQTGGGLYESDGTIVISGGTVSYNKTEAGAGGGIQCTKGKLHIYGGSIVHNESFHRGGGIRTYNGTDFLMAGGEVSHNTATNGGGGIYLQTDGKITGGYICNNKVLISERYPEAYGGAVMVGPHTTSYTSLPIEVDITGGVFSGNVVEGDNSLGGAFSVSMKATLNVSGIEIKNNTAAMGGAIGAFNPRNLRSKETYLNVDNCRFVDNHADRGGAIFGSWVSENRISNSVFTGNTATQDGGAIYMRKDSSAWINTSEFTENTAGQKGAAIYIAEDAQLEDLTITGNTSSDGYALYIVEGAFDGMSIATNLLKLGGKMKVHDNTGGDMFIGKDQVLIVSKTGLTEGTKIHVELEAGILTNTLLGQYDYEGGDQKYVITCGDRSVTDPEPIPVEEPEVEVTEPVTDPTAATDGAEQNAAAIGIGGIAAISGVLIVGVIAVLAAVAVKKKKKAESAKDTVQE